MFRRVEDTLEADPSFPADLTQLGFFINNVGQICMIDAPEKHYVFHATNKERVNEVRREAMQTCQRNESEKRLSALGLNRIYLPDFSTTKPAGPHVPILAPSPEILKKRKRIVLLVNDALQDLGILAYRQLQRELGINGGSVVNFAKEMIKRSAIDNTAEKDEAIFAHGFELDDDNNTLALMVLNTGQLLYSHKHNQAMTMRSWSAMPRKSVTHDMIRIHEEENRVFGHRNPKEHIKSVFDEVIYNADRVAPDAEVYVIAIEDGTENILSLLADDFEKYGTRVTAMALVHSFVDDSQVKNPSLKAFLRQRTRQWKYTDLTPDPLQCTGLPDDYSEYVEHSSSQLASTIMQSAKHISWHKHVPPASPTSSITTAFHRLTLPTPTTANEESAPPVPDAFDTWSTAQTYLCPTFGGGSISVGECIFTTPTVQTAIISFFEQVAQSPSTYRNPPIHLSTSPSTNIPNPTPLNPLVLSPSPTYPPLPPQFSPEQSLLDTARQTLTSLRAALSACPSPSTNPALAPGREKLAKKIQAQQRSVGELEKKALGSGGLREGEAREMTGRESWKPMVEGRKVAFAGTEVDSELLKAAGLFGSAEGVEGKGEKREEVVEKKGKGKGKEEEEREEGEGDGDGDEEEKAFI